MNNKIMLLDFIFWIITLLLWLGGKKDPSSSLGFGILMLIFWIIIDVYLLIQIFRRRIQVKTIPDLIGVILATPAIPLLLGYIFIERNID